MAYDYLSQSILATMLIEMKDNDAFYNPSLQSSYTGYASTGQLFTGGQAQSDMASWATESSGAYRGTNPAFPTAALVLLSNTALTILDETNSELNLWMQFLLSDSYALSNNFALGDPLYASGQMLQGFQPRGLTYANGIISVIYSPDPGSVSINGTLVVNLDLAQDRVYLETVAAYLRYDVVSLDGIQVVSAVPNVPPPTDVTLSTYTGSI